MKVIRGGVRVFAVKESKKMKAFMTVRNESWSPSEEGKTTFIKEATEVKLGSAEFDNIVIVDKTPNGYFYWYWFVQLDSKGEKSIQFKKVLNITISKEMTNFVETSNYIFMYSGNDIRAYAKSSNFRTMDGIITSEDNETALDIMGVFGEARDSLIDGQSIKTLLMTPIVDKSNDNQKEKRVFVQGLVVKPGNMTCHAMTYLLTFWSKYYDDQVSMKMLTLKSKNKVIPPVNYTYFIKYGYTYGSDGIIFWIWCFTMNIFLTIFLFLRVCKAISLKSLISNPLSLMAGMTKGSKNRYEVSTELMEQMKNK